MALGFVVTLAGSFGFTPLSDAAEGAPGVESSNYDSGPVGSTTTVAVTTTVPGTTSTVPETTTIPETTTTVPDTTTTSVYDSGSVGSTTTVPQTTTTVPKTKKKIGMVRGSAPKRVASARNSTNTQTSVATAMAWTIVQSARSGR